MIKVSKSSLPHFVRNSHFARDWFDSDEMVEIDSSVLKMDDTVCDISQLAHLLETLQFWIVDDLPNSVIEFVLNNASEECASILRLYEHTLPYVTALLLIISVGLKERWKTALQIDCLECVVYLFEQKLYNKWKASCSTAAKAGSLKCLKYLHEVGCPWSTDTCASAARNGYLQCLEYLHQQGCPWNSKTTIASAAQGQTECLAYALENLCPYEYTAAELAARNGHLSAVKLLWKLATYTVHEWKLITAAAAESGQLDCLRYLQEERRVVDMLVMMKAARGGQIECIKYLRGVGYGWSHWVAHMAAYFGHLSCLKYVIEHGCTWKYSVVEEVANNEN